MRAGMSREKFQDGALPQNILKNTLAIQYAVLTPFNNIDQLPTTWAVS